MPAAEPTPLSIIVSAFRKLGVMGAAQSTPKAEDLELGLNEFNEVAEMRNLRARNAFFQRSQQFVFGTSKQSYTIGGAGDGGDFTVSAGRRPVKITFAELVLTGQTPNVQLEISNVTIDQYKALSVPDLSSTFPWMLYYVADWPLGILRPYPTYPTDTTNALGLTWWNQFETVDIADVSVALSLPFGYRRALAMDVARACYPSFAKRTDLAELKEQWREAWAEVRAQNKTPSPISTTDGVQSDDWGSTFNYRDRMWS